MGAHVDPCLGHAAGARGGSCRTVTRVEKVPEAFAPDCPWGSPKANRLLLQDFSLFYFIIIIIIIIFKFFLWGICPFEICFCEFLSLPRQPPEGVLSELFKLVNEQIKIKSMATGWSVM